MYIMESMRHNFGGFTLDTASIGNTSTSKTKITLPYTGQLPADLNDTTGAVIVITLQVGLTVNVLLTVERAGKEFRYPVKATPEEIDAILWPLFWIKTAETEYRPRFNNGLSEYWNGHYQAEFTAWHSIGQYPIKITSIIQQLSPEKRASLYRMIDFMRSKEATAG